MRGVTRVLVSFVGLACLAATTAWAQHPQAREGFWIGFGFGYGSAKPSCDGCGTLDSRGGFTGFLKLGGTLSKQVLLGGEVNAWTKADSGVTDQLGNVSAAVYYYPAVSSGRSEERRVGEECRSRWSPYHLKKKMAWSCRRTELTQTHLS